MQFGLFWKDGLNLLTLCCRWIDFSKSTTKPTVVWKVCDPLSLNPVSVTWFPDLSFGSRCPTMTILAQFNRCHDCNDARSTKKKTRMWRLNLKRKKSLYVDGSTSEADADLCLRRHNRQSSKSFKFFLEEAGCCECHSLATLFRYRLFSFSMTEKVKSLSTSIQTLSPS